MKVYCDKCGRYLGDYLYGKGGVVDRAKISGTVLTTTFGSQISMPDIVCSNCNDTPKRLIIGDYLTNNRDDER